MTKVNINIGPPPVSDKIAQGDHETHHWWVIALTDDMDDETKYTDWEREFIDSLSSRFEDNPNYHLSEKQATILQRIYEK